MRNSLRRPETGPPPSATPGGRRPRAGSRWRGRALALTALGAAIIAFLIIVFGGGGGSGHTATQASTSAAKTSHQKKTAKHRRHRVTPRSTFRVGLTKFKLTEPAGSATPNAHTSTGASARVIPVGVRYPAQGQPNGHSNPRAAPDTAHGPYPLIVFSQGYDTAASAYAALINAWTTAGYIVAAPTYPFTDPSTPGGPNESDIVNHPTDLRFVLTSLLRGSGPAAPLKRLIDPSKTAVIGQSDGGDVSLAVAANNCCRIGLLKAAVILSGAELARFGGSYYTAGGVPLLAVQGSADPINPPGCSAQLYDGSPQPKYYLDLENASHLTPYTQPGRDRATVAAVTIAFLNHYLKGKRAALTTMKRDANVPGVATLMTGSSVPATSLTCPGAP